MSKTAVFGGTFNPFHIGHYEMLKALEEDVGIGKILVVPDKIPPHKSTDFLADDGVRIEMCRLAAEDFTKSEVCLVEFKREGKSYTIDTVAELKKEYNNLTFVMGGDMLVYFDRWYRFEDLIKEMEFYVFRRSDTDVASFSAALEKLKKMGMRVFVSEKIIPAVSSTEIRQSFEDSISLLPPKIYKFLSEKEIYGDRL